MLYQDRPTWLHRLHPHTKGLGLLLFFLCALILSHPAALLLPVAALAGLVALTRLWPAYRKVGWLLLILFVATVAMWTLVYGRGEALLELGPVTVSRAGLLFGLGMALRLTLMVAAGVVYLAVTRMEETTWSLRRAGVPYRVAFALGLSFRLLPLFLDQARRIREAQMARGLDLTGGSPLRRARAHLPLIAPVFLTALRRADRLAVALECRGFGSPGEVTSLREPRFSLLDLAALAGLGGLLALEVWMRWQGWGVLAAGRLPDLSAAVGAAWGLC